MVMMSPEPTPANPFDFRAPPPSPIGTGRRSCVTNDDVLSDFLEHSLRVPDLVLPDNIFPRQKFIDDPPTVDLRSLRSSEVLDSMCRIGCFQLVNHGIPVELIDSVLSAAASGVFSLSPEKKAAVTRSPEKPYGFEEYSHGEEESELSEEFVWSREEGLKLEMETISPFGYSNFSEKMEALTELTEEVGEKILKIFRESCGKVGENEGLQRLGFGSVWCVYKQKQIETDRDDEWENCLKYEVIRMLIRGSDFSHAFSFHFCHGSSLFHVYSKRGWISFTPDQSALVITVGDQIQAWSGGQYKHVIGRPIYKDDLGLGHSMMISMAFLYSPTSPPNTKNTPPSPPDPTISLAHQALFALFLTLFLNFLSCILNQL